MHPNSQKCERGLKFCIQTAKSARGVSNFDAFGFDKAGRLSREELEKPSVKGDQIQDALSSHLKEIQKKCAMQSRRMSAVGQICILRNDSPQ